MPPPSKSNRFLIESADCVRYPIPKTKTTLRYPPSIFGCGNVPYARSQRPASFLSTDVPACHASCPLIPSHDEANAPCSKNCPMPNTLTSTAPMKSTVMIRPISRLPNERIRKKTPTAKSSFTKKYPANTRSGAQNIERPAQRMKLIQKILRFRDHGFSACWSTKTNFFLAVCSEAKGIRKSCFRAPAKRANQRLRPSILPCFFHRLTPYHPSIRISKISVA